MTTILLALALFCGQTDQELAIALAIAINAPQPEQQSVITAELPEVPDLTPEPIKETAPRIEQRPAELKYETRQVTKYRTVRVKHCNGRRCWYTNEQRPYTVTEQVPVAAITSEADQYATPIEAGNRILSYLKPASKQTLLDLGSGDGRMVVEWARWTGYPAIGIEMDPQRIEMARNLAERKGVSHLTTFIEGDFTRMDWPAADVIYLYQFPDVMEQVAGRLKSADRVVSFAHAVPGLNMTEHGDFYSWRKPQPVKTTPVAYWQGKQYTRPVCNKPNCTMCNTIRAQLGMR